MLDILITNATVINEKDTTRCHIGIAAGKIAALFSIDAGVDQLPQATSTLDAEGRLVIPGGVDGHCHIEQTTGRYKSLDTYKEATIAALWGGTTTVIDFGIPATDAETPLEAVENKLRLAEAARCDVALHGCVITWDETIPGQLNVLANYGIPSVKLYTTNRGSTMADEDTILNVMEEMVRLNGLAIIHSEHDAIIANCTSRHAAAGAVAIEHLHSTRPELAESASVREILAMAEYAGASVYFVHQTTAEAVDMVRQARSRGLDAYSETCPHYLVFDERVYASEAAELFACCPPMRSAASVTRLRHSAAVGDVDIVASDHSCYSLVQKQSQKNDVRDMPHGLPGVETRMPATYTALVEGENMSLNAFVSLFAAAPARIHGLKNKGSIAPGYDDDLVIFDPNERRIVDSNHLHMGTDFSPFHGVELAGWPSSVITAGRVVMDEGLFNDPGPVGRFIRRAGPTATGRGRAVPAEFVKEPDVVR